MPIDQTAKLRAPLKKKAAIGAPAYRAPSMAALPTVATAPAPPKVSQPVGTFGNYSPGAAFNRDATLAQNAYSRFLAQQRGARDISNIDINMTKGLEGLASGYAHRGLANSGIYGTAQNDYAQNWMQGRQDAMDRLYQELRQASYGDAGAWGTFGNNVADTAEERYQKMLQTAADLSALKPFLGG